MNRSTSSSAGSLNYAPEETNWSKFQKFLKEYLSAILELEQQNRSGIHLFAHNGTWLAFDRSACRLSRLFPEEDLTQLTLPENKITVMLKLTNRQTATLKSLYGVRLSTPTHIYIA